MMGLSRGRVYRYGFITVFLASVCVIWASCEARASFDIKQDSFAISNAPGYCFAMTCFSRWYYLNRQSEPPLRKVMNKRAQQRVARELQEFYSKHLIKIQADYCNRYQGNKLESFNRFVSGLSAGEPRIVLLMNKGARGAVLHAVLAYRWLPEQKLLKVYDPNYNCEERFIDLERGDYTSLDITYHSICFPEVLQDHESLVRKMQDLYTTCVIRTPANAGPVANPQFRKAAASGRQPE